MHQSRSSKSTRKSPIRLFNRSNRAQEKTTELPLMQSYDSSKLFEQFKRHLLREDKKDLKRKVLKDNKYKDLLCELRKSNEQKRKQVSKIEIKLKTMANYSVCSSKNLFKGIRNEKSQQVIKVKQEAVFCLSKIESLVCVDEKSSCKFKLLRPMTTENKFIINNTSQSSLLTGHNIYQQIIRQTNMLSPASKISKLSNQKTFQPQTHCQKPLDEISRSIMMIQVEQTRLKNQITSLQQSLNKLTKQLAQKNKDLQRQITNEQKYKHISYLTTSIEYQTQNVKIKNSKGYSAMVLRQQNTISQIKEFKRNLREENDQIYEDYINGINQLVHAQLEKSASNNRDHLFQAYKNISSNSNNSSNKAPQLKFQLVCKTLVQKSQRLNFVENKSLKRLVDYLDSILELLQRQKSNLERNKKVACSKVILFKMNKTLLPEQQVDIMERIQKFQAKYSLDIGSVSDVILSCYYSLVSENQKLQTQCLTRTTTRQQFQQELKKISQQHEIAIGSQQINNKAMAQPLGTRNKINYMIKKNSIVVFKAEQAFCNLLQKFRHMLSLALTLDVGMASFRDTVLQIDSIFDSGLFLKTQNQMHDLFNQRNFRQILVQKGIDQEIARELTELMFINHIVSITLHKSLVKNSFKLLSTNDRLLQKDLLNIIERLRADCEEIYTIQFSTLTTLLSTCFKSIQINKYETKLSATSIQRDIFLPFRPAKNFHYLQMVDQKNESVDKEQQNSQSQSKKNITFISETTTVQQNPFQKDPMKIIFNLQRIKNQSLKKFKPLNFFCSGKTYQYNQQIIIPDFPMIVKCEDF